MATDAPKARSRKKIFIVDDHPVFRDGLTGLLKGETTLSVCGNASNASAALGGVEKTKPDLVLVDISLPGRSGLELIKDLIAMRDDTAILVISMHDETLYAERVLRAGARGYLMKQEGPQNILRAIRQVLAGQIYVSAKISPCILEALSGRRRQATRSPIAQLTDREFEILQLIGLGKDSHTIGRQLHLSFKTVDAHRAHIKEKLRLKNATELISYSARWVQAQASAGV